jgi:predicted nucleic acid-binding protein
MEVFLDTNILVDVFLRPQAGIASRRVIEWCKVPGSRAWISWPTVATLAYLLEQSGRTRLEIETRMRLLSKWVEITAATSSILDRAIEFAMKDFEDALQVAFAEASGADVIVTRNVIDFGGSPVAVLSPEQFLAHHAPTP